ncbi:glutathione S-transferase family protein [Vibrio diabolicus]
MNQATKNGSSMQLTKNNASYESSCSINTLRNSDIRFQVIGSQLCPFVQRALITLIHKNASFDCQFINLSSPPDWFLALSPRKKVPILLVDEEHVIFESAVINELIDDLLPNKLMPLEPIKKAQCRSWIEFSSACFFDVLSLTTVRTVEEFSNVRQSLLAKLKEVENILGETTYFNDIELSLVDIAFAPLFIRLNTIEAYAPIYDDKAYSQVPRWREKLLNHPSVVKSIPNDFETLYEEIIWKRQGYLSECMVNSDRPHIVKASLY